MPELPEVETVRRGLAEVLVGTRLERVELRRPNLRFPFPPRFRERLEGQKIESLGRRAKYLQVHLSGGEVLIMHLGMSGRFTIIPAPVSGTGRKGVKRQQPGRFHHGAGGSGKVSRDADAAAVTSLNAGKHDHVLFATDTGVQVIYNDARRFGFMDLIDSEELTEHRLFSKLGPEPLGNELNADYVAGIARARKTDLKSFLMDQRNIAGLGNIYVCEALFRAGLSPARAAHTLSSKSGKPLRRTELLVTMIRNVLRDAIEAGGSSLRDYRQADGELGYFQHAFAVYGREGEACIKPRCRGTIVRIVQAGRSSFYCNHCQK